MTPSQATEGEQFYSFGLLIGQWDLFQYFIRQYFMIMLNAVKKRVATITLQRMPSLLFALFYYLSTTRRDSNSFLVITPMKRRGVYTRTHDGDAN